jgi:hypothetical protein
MSLRTCRVCGLESDDLSLFKKHPGALHDHANLCLNCARDKGRQYMAKRRAIIDEFKRQPCAICGKTFPVCAMDFHHKDESSKVFGISNAITWHTASMEDILKEINKCIVVCACCHRILHFNLEDDTNGD